MTKKKHDVSFNSILVKLPRLYSKVKYKINSDKLISTNGEEHWRKVEKECNVYYKLIERGYSKKHESFFNNCLFSWRTYLDDWYDVEELTGCNKNAHINNL